ncbi:MAG: acetate kinase [Candidatus Woesearchaeota archaeon]|nr:acetate kinase [Candidatus Woesearchaeota archaeon]
MFVLVINAGSSTLKYALFRNIDSVCSGMADRIGFSDSYVSIKMRNSGEKKLVIPIQNHQDAIKHVLQVITDSGAVKKLSEIDAIGHRVVHGGELFSESVIIDRDVISAIKKYSKLAPLHNPSNLLGIEACEKLMPDTTQVAVFDTAFHQTIPEKSFMYAIPMKFYKQNKIRRYGFHGISHKFVSIEAAKILKKDARNLKIITCHLGSGASIAAIEHGKSVDTSMGFTPLEGLMMCTRSGDIDAGLVLYLEKEMKMSKDKVDRMLNKESGILGILGFSSDFRDILSNLKNRKKPEAKLAFDMFVHRVQKYIGAYSAVMNGVDAIVFTAGVGQNSGITREAILSNFEYLGVKIDRKKNLANETVVSAPDSKVKVLVIKTNEELMIAEETEKVLKKK